MKYKKIDLHTHTNVSDGVFSPEDLIDYAIENDISALAITDHDTIDGIEQGMLHANKRDFNLISGVEFSLGFNKGSFHLVGLYVDFNNERLVQTMKKLQVERINRAKKMVKDLQKHGIDITYDEVESNITGTAVGKPHIARAMIDKGYGENIREIFKNYMIRGKPGWVVKDNIPVAEAVSVVKDAGGISIIAHPVSLNIRRTGKFKSMLRELIGIGVDGIEVYSSMHSMGEVFKYERIAREYGLVISGGSDFHGDKKEEIGTYSKGKFIPEEVLVEIESYRKKFS